MDPVPQRRGVRRGGRHLPDRRRLLRLQAPLLLVGRELALRRRRDHPGDDRRGALPERWDPTATRRPARHAAGEGAPVGHPRCARSGEGGRLLAAALRAHLFDPRHRRRRPLHRRQRAAAGHLPAVDHRPAVVPALPRQHLAPWLDVARRRRRPLGARLARRRRALSGVHPAVHGRARGVDPRGAVHRPQHHRDETGARTGRDRDQTVPLQPGQGDRDEERQREPGHDPQHPSSRPCHREPHVPASPEPVRGLPVQPARHRPLPDPHSGGRDRHDPGGARRPRPRRQRHPAAVLGGPSSRLHPRVRRRTRAGQLGDAAGPARLPREERSGHRGHRAHLGEPRDPAGVLRREHRWLRRDQCDPPGGGLRRTRRSDEVHRVLRFRGCGDRFVPPQGGLRTEVLRLEPSGLELHRLRFAHRLPARRA